MISSLPSLPTDNLYKFMALAGLFTALFSYGFLFWDIKTSADQAKIIDIEMQYLTARTQSLKDETEYLKKIADEVENLASEEFHSILSEGSRILEESSKIEKELYSLQSRTATLSYWFLNLARFFLLLTGLFGYYFAQLGFRLWKVNVQEPLDKILFLNLQKATLENQKLNSELETR